VEDHIKVASSIQEHKTGTLNTAADVQLNLCWIDVSKGLRRLYIFTIKVIESLEKSKFVNSICENNIKIISYIKNFVILKFVPAIATEILVRYINFFVPHSK